MSTFMQTTHLIDTLVFVSKRMDDVLACLDLLEFANHLGRRTLNGGHYSPYYDEKENWPITPKDDITPQLGSTKKGRTTKHIRVPKRAKITHQAAKLINEKKAGPPSESEPPRKRRKFTVAENSDRILRSNKNVALVSHKDPALANSISTLDQYAAKLSGTLLILDPKLAQGQLTQSEGFDTLQNVSGDAAILS